jgi:hypothetical protein
MTESALNIYCARVAGKATLATRFGLKVLSNKNLSETKLVFLYPILELKLIGLYSVDVVLVDVGTEHVETRTASNLSSIYLLS